MRKFSVLFLACLFVLTVAVSAAELEPGEVVCSRCSPFIGDLNGDGLDDLLVRNEILFNLNGRFAPGVTVSAINAEDGIRLVADFNSDGMEDVIVSRRSSSTGPGQPWTAPGPDRLLINTGSANFIRGDALPAGSVLQAPDFTGDGKADLILMRNEGHVLARGTGLGSFVEVQRLPFPDGMAQSVNDAFAVGDLNGDGRPDLVLPRQRELFFYFATADRRYAEPVKRYTHLTPLEAQIADVNGDAKRDIVFISLYQQATRLTVLFGDGRGHFPRVAHMRVPADRTRGIDTELRTLAVADFFAGGAYEMAVAAGPGDVAVLSAVGDRLTEVARLKPRLVSPYLRAGQFRRDEGVDLFLLGHTKFHNEAQLIFTSGSFGAPQSAQQHRRRTSRSRAVGHLSSAPGAGEYDVTVSGACAANVSGRWQFVREGMFLDITGVRGLQNVEAAVIDNEVIVRVFINDMGRTRLLEGSLYPNGPNALKGMLFETNPPCGGEWVAHEVQARR